MNRNSFIAGAAVGAATPLLATTPLLAATTADVPGGRNLVESRSAFDAQGFDSALGRPAEIRELWQNLGFKPGVFDNIKNALNGLQFGFGYPPDTITMAAANHGPSSAYTYSDEIWAKYRIGEFFGLKTRSGDPIVTNVFLPRKSAANGPADPNDEHSRYQDASIEALQARGVLFLTCHTAVEEQGGGLVKAGHAPSGMSAADVAADILTHLIPGAIVVPSMVATIAVLQRRFGYTYITVQS